MYNKNTDKKYLKSDINTDINAIIESINLSWKPENAKEEILSDINIRLEPGHVYGIIGPNGAGKSSLLRHILAFLQSKKKECMTIGGISVNDYSRKQLAKILSFVPQKTDIDTDFTAEEIVMTGRTPYQNRWNGESKEDKEAVKEAFELTGSSHLADKQFSNLSGGEAQKIIITRAVAQDTPWIILDEPIASLDIKNQIEIMQTLQQLNKEKKVSVLMVLHDINLAGIYCDRLIMLKKGKVLENAKTSICLTEKNLKKLYDIDFFKVEAPDGHIYYLASQPPSTASVKPLT